ncbi:MAG: 3-deoxy-D-manno-octulosonic acid transferase [Desulfobulbaceae bacterium]|nr:3-deoxy-D-manno-octulosonic acid transferase [Desulfobulbaceae bacterium]
MRKTGGPTIWLHGASVGEIIAAGLLLRKIKKRFPEVNLVVTAVTEQGLKMARQNMGDNTTCLIAPLDLPGATSRAIRAIKPDIYLCLETELWPNTLAGMRKSGAACFLLNARLSEKSFRHYRYLRGLTRQVLDGFSGIAAITGGDAERLIALGAPPERVAVSGNLKYDLPPIPDPETTRRDWQKILGLTAATPVLVAGSTHSGEELLLLQAFADLKRDIPGLVLILAPRHLTRLGTIQAEISAAGAQHDLLSQVKQRGRTNEVVVIDSMGDLATLYSVATFVFCGGSLVERGGHNIMEAARWGRPVFYGPSMKDFRDAKELLETSGGGFPVDNADELREKIRRLAAAPDLYQRAAAGAARSAAGQNGASERQLQPVFAALNKLQTNKKFQPTPNPA